MKRKIPWGGVLVCDMPGCGERFTTYSMSSLLRRQAQASGWSRISGLKVRDVEGYALSRGKVDVCPVHATGSKTARTR